MNTAFVTCIYDNLANTRFGGRGNRMSRYIDSLRCIADTGVDIFCFTSKSELELISNKLQDKENITVIAFELIDFPYHTKIHELKKNVNLEDPFWTQRCVEIMWGKFLYIQKVLDMYPELKKIYWIDSGLSHRDVISSKYTSPELLEQWITENNFLLFTPEFITQLNKWVDDKIMMIMSTQPHSCPIPEKYNSVQYDFIYGATGGLFGGSAKKMKIMCSDFFTKVEAILADDVLYGEENIMAGVRMEAVENYKIFYFDSWYHEGWGDWHNPNVINYSNFFDEVLAYDK